MRTYDKAKNMKRVNMLFEQRIKEAKINESDWRPLPVKSARYGPDPTPEELALMDKTIKASNDREDADLNKSIKGESEVNDLSEEINEVGPPNYEDDYLNYGGGDDYQRQSKDKVFVQDGYLWVSYSPGSGKTTRLTPRMFITDKSDDDNFDSNAIDIAKWSETEKPLMKNLISRVHKIPVYDRGRGRTSSELSIWGGIQSPKSFLYMCITKGTTGINVISFFEKRNEVTNWIKGQTRGYKQKGEF